MALKMIKPGDRVEVVAAGSDNGKRGLVYSLQPLLTGKVLFWVRFDDDSPDAGHGLYIEDLEVVAASQP
jgi:ribosomal protein L24